jgi:hypothetical protein
MSGSKGNVLQRFGLVSVAALLVCGACSSSSGDSPSGVAPAFSGTFNPSQPAPPAGSPGVTENSEPNEPAPSANPPSNVETAVGNNVPLVPSQPVTGGGGGGETTPPEPTPAPPAPAEMPPTQPTEPAPPTPPVARTQVFLLFGQSNMWGVPNPQQQDLAINPRVEVLTINACATQQANQWKPAQPPLHGCVGQIGTGGQGPGVGPGDYFAKTVADAFPNDTILLVPGAVPGVSINTFQRGQQNYTNLLNRARMAQQRGEIRGMIFHQGESDAAQPNGWPMLVKNVVDALRSDLGIPEVPFIAGELVHNPPGCCEGHNAFIAQLPNVISNTFVALADDNFAVVPASRDMYGTLHFDLTAQREFGRRYGELMVRALGAN